MSGKWAAIWTFWIVALICSFALFEGEALHTGGTTLSAFVWTITLHWPLLPFICGLLAGGLAVHFWWTNQGLK